MGFLCLIRLSGWATRNFDVCGTCLVGNRRRQGTWLARSVRGKKDEKSSAAIADLVRTWSSGYQNGVVEGVQIVMNRMGKGMTPAEITRELASRFERAGRDLDSLWRGERPDSLAEEMVRARIDADRTGG